MLKFLNLVLALMVSGLNAAQARSVDIGDAKFGGDSVANFQVGQLKLGSKLNGREDSVQIRVSNFNSSLSTLGHHCLNRRQELLDAYSEARRLGVYLTFRQSDLWEDSPETIFGKGKFRDYTEIVGMSINGKVTSIGFGRQYSTATLEQVLSALDSKYGNRAAYESIRRGSEDVVYVAYGNYSDNAIKRLFSKDMSENEELFRFYPHPKLAGNGFSQIWERLEARSEGYDKPVLYARLSSHGEMGQVKLLILAFYNLEGTIKYISNMVDKCAEIKLNAYNDGIEKKRAKIGNEL